MTNETQMNSESTFLTVEDVREAMFQSVEGGEFHPRQKIREVSALPYADYLSIGFALRACLLNPLRHEELIQFGIEGAVAQVKLAHEISSGKGAININVLWEMGGAQEILEGVLDQTRGMVTGVTCGAGMPYKLSEIAARYNVHYLPIVSSARAFRNGG